MCIRDRRRVHGYMDSSYAMIYGNGNGIRVCGDNFANCSYENLVSSSAFPATPQNALHPSRRFYQSLFQRGYGGGVPGGAEVTGMGAVWTGALDMYMYSMD
eukprot:TRINITY_DN22462_c0_g1_i2.p2 TRINITY_DN22462_c0_g1~~TRINITY_DN22462_c0_g1_i2.p2  ORF type:complete len:101 (+),score=14.74 TRINITY_DN22462_c0_g1_i2:121-423(+)